MRLVDQAFGRAGLWIPVFFVCVQSGTWDCVNNEQHQNSVSITFCFVLSQLEWWADEYYTFM